MKSGRLAVVAVVVVAVAAVPVDFERVPSEATPSRALLPNDAGRQATPQPNDAERRFDRFEFVCMRQKSHGGSKEKRYGGLNYERGMIGLSVGIWFKKGVPSDKHGWQLGNDFKAAVPVRLDDTKLQRHPYPAVGVTVPSGDVWWLWFRDEDSAEHMTGKDFSAAQMARKVFDALSTMAGEYRAIPLPA